MGNDPIQVNLVTSAPEPPTPDTIRADADAATTPESEMAAPPEARAEKTPQPTPEPRSTPSLTSPLPTPVATPHATPHRQATPRPVAKQITRETSRPPSPTAKSTASKQPGATRGSSTAGGRGDAAPSYRSNPQPAYPDEARRLEQQGLVVLDVLVSAEGRAVKVALKRSSGVRILDQAAIAAVRAWSFQPGRIAGVPAAAHVDVPVRFRLNQ